MKKLYCLLLLTLTIHAYAQKEFTPGKIIVKGDTINGLISTYRDSYGINFKNDKNETIAYSPEQIDGFVIDDISFISRKVKLRVEKDTVQEECFLQVLVNGRVSLYTYKNHDGEDIFFSKKGEETYQLRKIIEKVQLEKGGLFYSREKKEYLNMLNIILQDCDKIALPITDVALLHKDLIKIITKYNACFGEKAQVAQHQIKTKVSFGLKAGVNISNRAYYYIGTGYITGKLIGGFVKIPLSGLNRRLFTRIEVNMNDMGYTYENKSYKWNAFNLSAMLGNTFSVKKVRPYIGIGLVFSTAEKYQYSTLDAGLKNGLLGYSFEAGSDFSKFLLAVRHERFLNLGGNSTNIVIGYTF